MSRIFPSIERSIPCYSDSWHSIAVPRRIQCSGGCNVGSQIAMTKLVEWPVVDSTPLRSLVLYTGHVYVSLSCTCSFVTGISQIWEHNTRGWVDMLSVVLKPCRLIKNSNGQREKHVAFLKKVQKVFRRELLPFAEEFVNYLSVARKTSNLIEERLTSLCVDLRKARYRKGSSGRIRQVASWSYWSELRQEIIRKRILRRPADFWKWYPSKGQSRRSINR